MAFSRFFWTAFSLFFFPSVTCLSQPGPAAGQSAASAAHQRVFVSTPARDIQRLVSDCMTPRRKMHVLTPDTPVDDAITLLLTHGISGAPVVSPISGKLQGLISSSDFMFKDFAGALLTMEGSDESMANVVEMAQKIVGSTVKDLMCPHLVTIASTESMAHAADMMARRGLHRLLVVAPDDEHELVGILTRSDVMRDVMTKVRAALPEHGTRNDDDDGNLDDEAIDISEVSP